MCSYFAASAFVQSQRLMSKRKAQREREEKVGDMEGRVHNWCNKSTQNLGRTFAKKSCSQPHQPASFKCSQLLLQISFCFFELFPHVQLR